MSNRPYRDFDLPAKHLNNSTNFIPPKAREEAELTRRQSQRPGTLLAEFQHKGILVASRILNGIYEKSSEDFAANVLAPTLLNTAWYLFGQNAPTMRRRLKLEQLASDDPEQRPSAFMLRQNAAQDLVRALRTSQLLTDAIRHGSEKEDDLKKELGRIIGHSALTLACVPVGDEIGYSSTEISNFDLQLVARNRGLGALEQARVMSSTIGAPPSVAQLADSYSPLAVYWQRLAPNQALEAYQEATSGII